MEADRLGEAPRLGPGFLADTSFLIFLAEAKRGFMEELEARAPGVTLLVIEPVLEELRALSRKERRARGAPLALRYAERLARIPHEPGAPDDALLLTAEKRGLGIATLDRELRKRARARGLAVLTARGGRPQLEGFLR